METGEDQNSSSANGNTPSGGNSRPPQISQMSLYERQAVQALQALQRQPNAAQYFQQLMLQQQINSAQLHNLAAVQQANLAASRQSSSPSNSVSQATSTAHCSVNLSTTSGGGTMTNPRPLGPATSATSSALSQSVLLGGNSAGQGQMYLRVNRSLRAPLGPQLIFMPGGTATAAVATVAQQQPQQQQQQQQQQAQQQQQQQEVTPTSTSAQSDNDQVQNLAMRCTSSPRVAAVKTEFPDRKETGTYSMGQQQQQFGQSHQSTAHQSTAHQSSTNQVQPQPQQLPNTKMQGYTNPNLPNMTVKGTNQSGIAGQQTANSSVPPSSSPSPSIPLSQILLSPSALCQARAVTTPAATVTHILVPTSNVPTSSQGYAVGSVAPKTNLGAQTLVVQPLQQSGANLTQEKLTHGTGPVPIQPKTVQANRLPVQMPPRHPPPILPAPPNNSQGTGAHHPPHVPVQLVGARQGSLGNSQALALAQARTCCAQDSAVAAGNPTSSGNNMVAMVTSMETGNGSGGGVCLKSPQSALPVSQMQTNQNPALSANQNPSPSAVSVAHSADGQNNSSSVGAPSAGDSVFMQSGPTQTKPVIGSLKRKSESDGTNEMSAEAASHCCPSMQDSAPPLSPAPSMDTVPEAPFSSPPTLSLSLPLSRGGAQGERAPLPQAVVKPQVLTHLIEGFVIQEGAEPFPVTGPMKERAEGLLPVAVPPTIQTENTTPAVMKCEYCENFAPASQFRGSKRFCSKTCAKRYNVSCSLHFRTSRGRAGAAGPPATPPAVQDGIARRRGPRRSSSEIACAKIAGRHLPVKCRSESSRSEDISSCDGEEEEDSLSLSPSSSFSCPQPTHCGPRLDGSAASNLPLDGDHFLSGSPAHWTVEEVCRFISSLQGCEDLAAQFLSQEIDGQALLLLKEEHLMSTMNIKLGPALKICASINNLRD
ncbi:polyhomeotic-like protein 1 [Chanos chanos]|uniref:Polyhomeotic-like protein 1 n=1 Tax=Chanos chanos TaxID=29144 RepID=A0A6J2W869_CHACN|nr:polyhomeotic-like protein 1 [Chanos chanos]